MHYAAMEVGEGDLDNGLADLQKAAKDAHVELMGGNLRDLSGNHPFVGTLVLDAPQGKVGVLGLSKFVPDPGVGIAATDPIEAGKAAVAELQGKHVVAVVALLHMRRTDAEEVLHGVPGIDLALVAHDGSAGVVDSSPPAYGLGQKGRDVARIDLDLGPGPAVDGTELGQLDGELRQIDANRQRLQDALARLGDGGAHPPTPGSQDPERMRRQITAQLEASEKRKTDLAALKERSVDARLAHSKHIQLTGDVADEPHIAEQVAQNVAKWGHTPGH